MLVKNLKINFSVLEFCNYLVHTRASPSVSEAEDTWGRDGASWHEEEHCQTWRLLWTMSSRVSSHSWPGTVGEDQQWRSWGCWCRWFLTRAFWRTSPWEAPSCQPDHRILGYINYKLNLNLLTQRRNWRRLTSNQKQEHSFLSEGRHSPVYTIDIHLSKNFSHHHSLWHLNRCLWRRIKTFLPEELTGFLHLLTTRLWESEEVGLDESSPPSSPLLFH